MNILHVVAGLPPTGGGIAETVPRLAAATARLGHRVTIATIAGNDTPTAAADAAAAAGVEIMRFHPSAPHFLYFSREMSRRLPELVARADVVHVHSQWTFPVWWAAQCAIEAGKPFVMSPHGCLAPVALTRSAWKKRLAGLLDRRCLRQAAAIHATSDAERQWIEHYLGSHPRIDVIPNGVDVLGPKPPPEPGNRTRRALFLGRLHPIKGLDLLLEAWGIANRDATASNAWELVIAGPDEQGTQTLLERQARRLGLSTVRFAGPVYGHDKARAFRDADIVLVPSRSESFGIVVAEALAAGVPVITTKAAPWGEIQGSCGWWVDVAAEPIGRALAEAMRLTDDQRAAMGARGRSLVESKYEWAIVARAMEQLYREVAGAG
jgi:glycosyltransferase involved in cell wall biosynthesis